MRTESFKQKRALSRRASSTTLTRNRRERASEGEQRAAAGGKHMEEGGAGNRSERREARSVDEDAESSPTAAASREGSECSRGFSPMLEGKACSLRFCVSHSEQKSVA